MPIIRLKLSIHVRSRRHRNCSDNDQPDEASSGQEIHIQALEALVLAATTAATAKRHQVPTSAINAFNVNISVRETHSGPGGKGGEDRQ